jgi:hypothetical protein
MDSIYKYLATLPDKRTSTALTRVFERFFPRTGEAAAAAAGVYLDIGSVASTQAEIDRVADLSARIVTTTATALSLTVTQHADRVVLVNTNSTVANTVSLPVATGSGARFTIINNIAQTQGSVVVAATGTVDTLAGVAFMVNSTVTNNAQSFRTSASSDKVSFNRTTTGGVGNDKVVAIDTAANVYTVEVFGVTAGTTATPFSET